MKKAGILLLITGVFIFAGVLIAADPTPLIKPKLCCIAGVYKGWHADTVSKTCPEPTKGEFTFYLYQEKGCGSKIWGKIVDPTHPTEPLTFKGTLTLGKGGCCVIKGRASKPGEWSDIKGAICKVLGKWQVKKGTYVSSGGCKGYWSMKWKRAHLLLTPHVIKKKE